MSRPVPRAAGPCALRRTRGVTVAVASTLVTAVGHVAGGGAAPDLGLLVVLFPLLAALVVTFASACRNTVAMVATLAAGQFAMHELLDLLAVHHADAAGVVGGSGPLMLGTHAAATLVMGVLIRDADVVLVAFVAALARVLPRRLVLPAADRPLPTFAVPAPEMLGATLRALLGPMPRRGPPIRV